MDITVIIILAAYMILMLVIGKIASKRVVEKDDFLVAGRSTPLYLIVGTMFATFWGGGTVIGATGTAFKEGAYGVIEDPFAAGLALIIVGLLFAKTMRKMNLTSIGELYDRKYGRKQSYYASLLMVPTYILWTAVQILAISKILNVMFDFDIFYSALFSTAVVVTYTFLGGLLAVVWTDSIQVIIIIIGLIILVVLGVKEANGIEEVIRNTPKDYWNILPRDYKIVPLITYLSLWVGMALGNLASPDIAQRVFIAKDDNTARNGMVISGVMYWIIGLIPIFIALIAITLVSQGTIASNAFSQDSELLIPLLAKTLLHPIMLGIFTASLVAAILSSASTSLFATAVIVSNDIIRPIYEKNKDIKLDKEMILLTRVVIVLIGLFSLIIALNSSNVFELTIFAFTLQFGVLFFPFIFAIKDTKFVTTNAIIAGMTVGALINLIGVIITKSFIPEPFEFYTLVPATANLLTIILVSILENTFKMKKENLYENTNV